MAATNLPELVDPAFRRRFSRWIRIGLPGDAERLRILEAHYHGGRLPKTYLRLAAHCLVGASGSDIGNFANRVASRHVVDKVSPIEALVAELSIEILERRLPDEARRHFIRAARHINPKRFTFRMLGSLLGISHTTAMNLASSRDGSDSTKIMAVRGG